MCIEEIKIVNSLDKFFELTTPIRTIDAIATYDYRVEYIHEGYEKTREAEGVKFHSDSLLSDDPIEKFVAYKVLTENPCKFDADNSLGTCNLMGEIYRKLWGATVDYSNFMTINGFSDEGGKSVLFGGDVYNSLQTTTGLSKYECVRLYVREPMKLKQMLSDMQEVMKVSHVLGNFGLVPAYFNAYRGTSKTIKDYLDRSLLELKQKGFSYLDVLIDKNRSSEKKRDIEAFVRKKKSQYRDFEASDYIKYINLMFLWDMHTDENQIRVISSNIQVWNEIVPTLIKKRSIFMAMMLYFAYKRSDVYKKMLKKISDAKNILNYESVFTLLSEVEGLTEADLDILREIKGKIFKSEINTNKEEKSIGTFWQRIFGRR